MAKRSPQATEAPKRPLRRCRYCKGKFRPTRDNQHFCTPAHRKLYWKYGALPFDKLMTRIRGELNKLLNSELAPIRAQLETLERSTVVRFTPERTP